jgi:cytochrome c553
MASDPPVLDQPWRTWSASIVIIILAAATLLGFVVLPIVQGRSAGLDALAAICRSLGIQAGSPAARQPSSEAKAQPVSQVAWTAQVIERLHHPNRQNGSELAANVCAGCHGETGISPDPQYPHMAGQSAFAIYKQLHDFKNGARENELMRGIVQDFDDEQMADVASHFAALTRGALDPQTVGTEEAEVTRLVVSGDPTRGLPACVSCHGTRAGGPIETPTLTGQRQEYITAQLQAFANGQRKNDVYARMRSIAGKLKADEIDRVARYYANIR